MKLKLFLLATIAVFMNISSMSAYDVRHYSFRHVNYNVGLSSSNVKCITEDSYGFIWLGTKNGLHRFDGIGTRRLRCYDYEKMQGNDNINALYEDKYKNLWVGTDRGIYRYNPVTDRFSFMDAKDKKTGEYANNWIQAIAGDGKGNVWALLPDVGVFRYHNNDVSYYSVLPNNGSFKEKFPSNLCVDRNGDAWVVTTGKGIYKYNKHTDRFDKIIAKDGETLDGKYFAQASEEVDGTLIFASSNGYLYRYSTTNNEFKKINFSAEGKIYLRSLECFDDEIWIGTQHGLYIINKQTGNERLLHQEPLNNFSLSDDIIYCIYKSRNGDAWLGTSYGGADYMTRKKFGFQAYGQWSGLAGRVVYGLTQARDNSIWIGTEDDGLFKLNPQTGGITKVPNNKFPSNSVLMLNSYRGNVYAGFSRGGLIEIDDEGKEHSMLNIAESDNSVYSYLRDSRGNEWVGLGYAFYRRDAGKKEFVRVNETGFNWIFNIFEAHDGTIWIATMGNGIWKYTPSTGKFKSYIYGDNSQSGLRSNSISAFMEDSRGNIWVSTDRGGISRYDKEEDRFTTFGIAEGLPDDVVYNILEDRHGNLWFGTNKGLVKFNPERKTVKLFTAKDGLPSNQFNYNSAIKGNDGLFYFGGIGGIVVFDPELESAYATPLSIYFTQLMVYDKEMTTSSEGSLLERNIMFTEKLELPYDKASFSVNVVSPDFSVGGNGTYSYKLEPVNKEWMRMSDNKLSFANLPPGSYKLCVKVENHGQTAKKELRIVITPPWWQSTWAYMAYTLLLLIAIAYWFRWYRGHKEKQLKERQRLFTINKEKELYQNKVNFFTEVAHEIRTPLTLIDAPLEAIEEIGTKNKTIANYLKIMRQNTKRLLNLTGQLLEFQKLGSNRLTLKYENVDIVALVNETIDRCEPTIILRGKTLEKDICEKEQIIASTDKEAVTKILSNLLNNALKYARHKISIKLSTDNACFMVSVTSDSDKISKEEKKRIFEPFYQIDKSNNGENGVGIGLPLSLSLAQLLGGILMLEEDDKNENTFVVKIPINKEGIEHNNMQTLESPDYVLEEDSNQIKEEASGYAVLIVEDNDSMRKFLADQISQSFTVETACNGKEAIAKLEASRIDIIVSDVMMPEMNGFDLCRTVKTDLNLSHIPFVFITAKNDLESKINGLKLGAEAYIEKPFSIKYFRQLIQSLLDNRRRERESFQKKPFFTVDNMHMPKADEEFMRNVTKIIEEHVGEEDFNVETMASLLCMSHSSLLRKIKVVFNMSPSELIRTVKLKKAAELIQEGKYLIGDICFMVGISSPSYFSKIFFAQFGISPKDFERQNRQKQQ